MLVAFLQFHPCQKQADRTKQGEEVTLIESNCIGLQPWTAHYGKCQSDDIFDSFSIILEMPNDQVSQEAF